MPYGHGGLLLWSKAGSQPLLSQVSRSSQKYLHDVCLVVGMYMGTVIAMPLAGILAQYVNWEAIFYVFGIVMFTANNV